MKKLTALNKILKSCLAVIIIVVAISFKKDDSEYVPIWFEEYGVEIRSITAIGDTLHYNKSSKENFKFIFYDTKGKSYCERYIYGKLYEKGYFESSLDTLKRYVSGRSSNGYHSPVKVQKYFEPIKNGLWKIYKNGKVVKTENYLMGGIQE